MGGVIRSLVVGFGVMFLIAPCAFAVLSTLGVILAFGFFAAWLIAWAAFKLLSAVLKASTNHADHSFRHSLASYPAEALPK